jgi:hypothetical protein
LLNHFFSFENFLLFFFQNVKIRSRLSRNGVWVGVGALLWGFYPCKSSGRAMLASPVDEKTIREKRRENKKFI